MSNVKMLGAVAGDIIGSVYEFANTKSTDFELFTPWSNFTDDSVMTLAVAKWLVEDEAHTIHYLIFCHEIRQLFHCLIDTLITHILEGLALFVFHQQ